MKNCINILLISVILILLFLNKDNFKVDHFFPYSDSKLMNKSIFIPLVPRYTNFDFNLFELINKTKFGINRFKNVFEIKNPTLNNIIIIPGLGDCILKQNNKIVWPINYENLNKNNYTSVHKNNNSHLNTIYTLLESLNYVEGRKLNTLLYNFIKLDISKVIETLKKLIEENTIIIAYDFGAVVANLCIQLLTKDEKKKIKKLMFICPTIGGVPLSLREYFSGNDRLNNNITKLIDTTLLSFPNKNIYDKPVMIYKSVSYDSDQIFKLIQNNLNEEFNFTNYLEIQNDSLKNPEIETLIVGGSGKNTPACYNYRNNLQDLPEKYSPNNYSNSTSENNKLLEGLQSNGDSVIALSSLKKLRLLWNCNLEIINDKNHYTILKSDELSLIILKYIL